MFLFKALARLFSQWRSRRRLNVRSNVLGFIATAAIPAADPPRQPSPLAAAYYDYLGSVGAVLYKRNNGGSNGPLNDWDPTMSPSFYGVSSAPLSPSSAYHDLFLLLSQSPRVVRQVVARDSSFAPSMVVTNNFGTTTDGASDPTSGPMALSDDPPPLSTTSVEKDLPSCISRQHLTPGVVIQIAQWMTRPAVAHQQVFLWSDHWAYKQSD
jgi:hypothetical protein